MQRHPSFAIPLGPCDFGPAKATGAVHADSLGAHAHGVLHRALHGTAERNATLELLADVLGNQLRIDFRTPDLDDVQVQFRAGQVCNLLAQVLDIGALLADDHTRTRRVDRDTALAVRTLDDHAADAGLLALFLDEGADLDVLVQQITVFTGIGVPPAVPGSVDLHAQADRIDFVSHQTCSST